MGCWTLEPRPPTNRSATSVTYPAAVPTSRKANAERAVPAASMVAAPIRSESQPAGIWNAAIAPAKAPRSKPTSA